jgi:hypothetical protein
VLIKVLLLARSAGSWWQSLQESSPAAEALLGGAAVTLLPVLDADLGGRRNAYWQAAKALAAALLDLPGHLQADWVPA